jgi:hypothetical protein
MAGEGERRSDFESDGGVETACNAEQRRWTKVMQQKSLLGAEIDVMHVA